MSKYKKDRSFTDYVHDVLTVPKIYTPLGWTIKTIDAEKLKQKDLNEGIDYILLNENGKTIFIQERFRDEYYKNYSDVTLRFRRQSNPNPKRIKSEFYKIKADYLVYGITNGQKFKEKRQSLTGFIKWAILDLHFIQWKISVGELIIATSSQRKCWIENEKLYCPENFNPDKSSSFIPFDVNLIVKLWGKTPIIAQEGFL
jgi:hypothetical protein